MNNSEEKKHENPAESNEAEVPKPITTEVDEDDLVHKEHEPEIDTESRSFDPDESVHSDSAPPPPPSSEMDVDDLMHRPDGQKDI